ncbi:30S ribosomal protein S16 [Candidatus Peregrinibacteria bacterium]|nr:MAG: 30S ribosomal protein S16 [Candidatus Peregrinibacteria bacterium]
MLVIRLTRIGKTNEPAYRIVVAEKRAAVKGAHMEVIGFYNPSENKKLEFKKDRFEFWVSKGAQASDTVASLMKAQGVSGMEKFIGNRNKKRKATKAPVESAVAPAPSAPAAEAPVAEAPAEEVAAQ